MSDLTEWLLACIAEDEAVAREVQAYARQRYGAAEGESLATSTEVQSDDGWLTVGPAHVLAVCKAHREIVELHKAWPVLVEMPLAFDGPTPALGDVNAMTFRMTQQLAWQTEQQYRERFGTEPPTAPMIRSLATIYADRPGWREEWAL